MVDTIVFDIGMVLMGWHPELDGLFDFDEETMNRVRAAIFESGLWAETDHGLRPDEEVFADMRAKDPGVKDEIDFVLTHLDRLTEDYDYPIRWIEEIKAKGKKVYYLSNYPIHLKEQVPQALYFIPYMDGGIFSAEVKLIKPEKEIFDLLMSRYHLDPATCLFIDDKKENVDGAIRAGLQGYHFHNFQEDYEKIMAYL